MHDLPTTGRIDAGADDGLESALCKIFGTETLWMVVNDIRCAAATASPRTIYERMLRGARVNMIFEGAARSCA